MYCSWIAGHSIYDSREKMVMDIHSFFAIICMMVFIVMIHPFYHKTIGKIYFRIMMPVLIITGMVLSILPERGHVIYDRRIFQMYGLTFLISNLQLFLSNKLLRTEEEWIMVYTWVDTLYNFFITEKRMLRYELVLLMIPMVFFTHILPNCAVIRKNHEYYGILSIYIGCAGMVFTLTQTQSFIIRMLIQNIPFLSVLSWFVYDEFNNLGYKKNRMYRHHLN